ncbi:MAG: hypothetical protein NC226_11205 [Bacteroides cellulosilyticus]|nr:hypothetical protein [Bacteroides cellulosilyticus]
MQNEALAWRIWPQFLQIFVAGSLFSKTGAGTDIGATEEYSETIGEPHHLQNRAFLAPCLPHCRHFCPTESAGCIISTTFFCGSSPVTDNTGSATGTDPFADGAMTSTEK